MTALEPRQFHCNRDHLVIPRSSDYVIDLVGYGYLFKASSAQVLEPLFSYVFHNTRFVILTEVIDN